MSALEKYDFKKSLEVMDPVTGYELTTIMFLYLKLSEQCDLNWGIIFLPIVYQFSIRLFYAVKRGWYEE